MSSLSKRVACIILSALAVSLFLSKGTSAKESQPTTDPIALYLKTAALTHVPWTMLAAVNQYEKSTLRSKEVSTDSPIRIHIDPIKWVGPLNPNPEDTSPVTISFFHGMGLDGNGDGKADQNDPEDVLYSMAHYLSNYGGTLETEKQGLWDYYHRDETVTIISELDQLYETFHTLDLSEHDFPIPLNYNYDYTSSWGAGRGWGGRRIHEGTDIFANYGTPVKATSYGVVELKGWNKYGGWRLGIRDSNALYHYYAHLQAYAKDIHKGSIVKPGDVIGYVGSSGYGPPGTSGRFPPHLHYGLYGYNGKRDYSFDPYPSLRHWEWEASRNKKN
ncbi:M23 family metallopeptidase [Pullulanibacillus sp. KACC 23026]|uniref:M23 family metallopeptidase n=1 Tax=Pullulanibacillus sp. KACC 23026 TaxID=3028315 RepID=UPI0023B13BE6|nr:M23 family metallopeptidase [Pullulanibacillus sp. KACC 23026]WEG13772.1 M23 family metallopeptidase [Pullulanibacillus sp. KACC 23026]